MGKLEAYPEYQKVLTYRKGQIVGNKQVTTITELENHPDGYKYRIDFIYIFKLY